MPRVTAELGKTRHHFIVFGASNVLRKWSFGYVTTTVGNNLTAVEGNASLYQVNSVSRITGEGRAEF